MKYKVKLVSPFLNNTFIILDTEQLDNFIDEISKIQFDFSYNEVSLAVRSLEDDREPVADITFKLLTESESTELVFKIAHLFVEERYRRQGIASVIFLSVFNNWLENKYCNEFFLAKTHMVRRDKDINNFYENILEKYYCSFKSFKIIESSISELRIKLI